MSWKIFSLFLIANLWQLKAQPVIEQIHLPKDGDLYYTSLSSQMLDSSFFSAGENLTWDFSDLGYFSHDTFAFLPVISSEVPIAYAAVFFNPLDPTHKASVCLKGKNFQLGPSIEATDVFHFFQVVQNAFIQVGTGATINGTPIPIKWNPTDTIFHLPLQYLDTANSYSFFNINIPSLGYFCEHRWRNYHADAYGVVTTPIGSFNALRIKTIMQYKDSVYYEQYGIGIPLTRSENIYEWYTPAFSIPVVKVTQTFQGNTIEYIDTTNYTGIANYLQIPMHLFPNPASSTIHLICKDNSIFSIELYNHLGQRVLYFSPSKISSSYTLDVSSFPNGFYFVLLNTKEGSFFEKLLIQR